MHWMENALIKRTNLDFVPDCYVVLNAALLSVSHRAQASAISHVARINLYSLVQTYGFMHKAAKSIFHCHIEVYLLQTVY